MSMTIRVRMTPESVKLIESSRQWAADLIEAGSAAIKQGVLETADFVRDTFFTGYVDGVGRSRKFNMLFTRSGDLRSAIEGEQNEPLSGFVGVLGGPVSAYAATQLFSGETVITPKSGQYLTIPIADGVDASGRPRFASLRDVGNVEFIRESGDQGDQLLAFEPTGGTYKRGPKKGQRKGNLLAVLVRRVVIKGSGALEKGVDIKLPRMLELIERGLAGVFDVEGGVA